MRLAAKIFIIVAVSALTFVGARMFVSEIKRQEAERRKREEGFNIKRAMKMIPLVGKVLKSAIKFIVEFPKRMKFLIKGIKMIGIGFYREIIAFGTAVPMLVTDAGKLVTCGVQRAVKLPSCWMFYLLDFIVGTLYAIFVSLPLYCIYLLFGIDLAPIIKLMFEIAEFFDNIVHDISGVHVIHYPDSIKKMCYACDMPDSKHIGKAMSEIGSPMMKIINGAMLFFRFIAG